VLNLPDDGGPLPQSVPEKQAKKLAYFERRAAKEGSLEVERADEASFPGIFRDLVRLHGVRWQARGMPGVMADDTVQRFHREVAARMLRLGLLRLYSLRIGGRVASVLYAFAHRQRTYYYLGGFEPQMRNLSPGMLLVGRAIRDAVDEDARWFDFLRGRESYKYDWGAVDQPVFRRWITQSSTPAN
jgi:CelD/BcsL family acetyltransferase involved in cellulose biosynthesis